MLVGSSYGGEARPHPSRLSADPSPASSDSLSSGKG